MYSEVSVFSVFLLVVGKLAGQGHVARGYTTLGCEAPIPLLCVVGIGAEPARLSRFARNQFGIGCKPYRRKGMII